MSEKTKMRMYGLFSTFTLLVLFAALAGAESKQEEGQKLIAQAVELSNIRAKGAPSFRLKATFRALANSSVDQGSYSETWLSREQWHRETEVGSFRRVEVGGPSKKWLLDTGKLVSPGAGLVASVLNLDSMPKQLKVQTVANKDLGGVATRCVESETEFAKEVYCVDLKDNTLLLHEWLSRLSQQSRSSYVYRDYQKFGDRLFPRYVRYMNEGQAGVEINVSEITPEPSADLSQFEPLPGAVEMSNCLLADMTPPREKSSPEPKYPKGESANRAMVILWVVVGTNGTPHDIKVSESGGAAFDTEAMKAVARWRFKPATCKGEPVAVPINIEVEFRH